MPERTIRKQYVVSDSFRYDLMFAEDSGPGYGTAMGWPCVPLASFDPATTDVAIVDHRMTPSDIERLAALARAMPNLLFAFTIVDPFTHHNDDGPYRELLLSLSSAKNVVILSKYQACEFTAGLRDRIGPDRYAVINYPFIADRVLAASDKRRSGRMIFAGAINVKIYPERETLYNAIRRKPWLRLLIHHLEHPGYPEIGDPLLHRHIGSQFVSLLSGFRFMFVSGSRCNLEFLKYRECAYAGCVPVGQAPDTFNAALRDCILPVDTADPWPALRSYSRLTTAELAQRAMRFADLQLAQRNPLVLNQQFDEFLAPHLLRLAAN